MKTSYTQADVRNFLEAYGMADPNSIEQLTEGQISQALGFVAVDGSRLVLRISPRNEDFEADKYAYEHYGKQLLVPRVLEIGKFGEASYYCITERAPGAASNSLSSEQLGQVLGPIQQVFAKVFTTDISGYTGYGHIDLKTGNAKYNSWRQVLVARLSDMGGIKVRQNAANIGIEPDLIDGFIDQYNSYLPFASETRRLIHGDLGFDNIIIDGNHVSAVIDWPGIGYGDWMNDFAKLEFWWPGRFGDPKQFADKFGLESEHIKERTALYWARTALSTIQWADEFKSDNIAAWLREHVESKLIK